MARLQIKAVPGARRDEIAGWLGERLKVRVSAPAEGGRANQAICGVLAAALGVRGRDVVIVSGHTSPEKVAEIAALSDEQLASRLPARKSHQ